MRQWINLLTESAEEQKKQTPTKIIAKEAMVDSLPEQETKTTYTLHINGEAKLSMEDYDALIDLIHELNKENHDLKIDIKEKVVPRDSTYESTLTETIRKGVEVVFLDENLHKWFKEKWVRFGPDGKIRGACARGSKSEGKPKCLPQAKAHAIGKKARKSAASKKRREDPNPNRKGKAKNVATKPKRKVDESSSPKDLNQFHSELQNRMREKSAEIEANTVIKKAQDPDTWLWEVGDQVYSEKTGKTYEITYTRIRDVRDHETKKKTPTAVYGYRRGEEGDENYERGEFIAHLAHDKLIKITPDDKQNIDENQLLREFFDTSDDDGGDDGFSEETLKMLAAQWYNGDEDPRVERTLAAAGWEIGQDEGYDDEPGVFVVQAGDDNGDSYLSWPASELKQLSESRLDELKCWPGYTRVKGVPAGAPGSCKKKSVKENFQGVDEATGDPKFDKMMAGIVQGATSGKPQRKFEEGDLVIITCDRYGNFYSDPNDPIEDQKPAMVLMFGGWYSGSGKKVARYVVRMFNDPDSVIRNIKETCLAPYSLPNNSAEGLSESCPGCGGPIFTDLLLAEEKDACYRKVRSRYKVWPSAYASGALVQCRKKGAANWGNKKKSTNESVEENVIRVESNNGRYYAEIRSLGNNKFVITAPHLPNERIVVKKLRKGVLEYESPDGVRKITPLTITEIAEGLANTSPPRNK